MQERWQRGLTVGELLVVVAVLGLIVAIGIPIVSEQIRQTNIRTAADNYAMSLKAVRMIAVSKRAQASMTVNVDPVNSYSYTDTRGNLRTIQLPSGVKITSSTNPITFNFNGSVNAQATTVMEATMTAGAVERWTITTSILGVTSVDHVRQ